MSTKETIYRDVIQLLLENMTVTELVSKMRVSPQWQSVGQINTIWDSLLMSKQLRDLLYPIYAKANAFTLQNNVLVDVHQAPLVKYLWDQLLAQRGRPQLLLAGRPNSSSFVMFMFVWNAFPHVYVDQQGYITGISTTSSMLDQRLISAVKTVPPLREEPPDDFKRYEQELMPVYSRYLASLTPNNIFSDNLRFLPAIWLDVDSTTNAVTLRRTYGNTGAIVQQFVNAVTGFTYVLKDNRITEVDWDVYEEAYNYINIDYGVRGNEIRFNALMYEPTGETGILALHDRPESVPPLIMYFCSVDGKALKMASLMLKVVTQRTPEVTYKEVPEGSYFYNHYNILGREGRIRACIGCNVSVQTKCSGCHQQLCASCFTDTKLHPC